METLDKHIKLHMGVDLKMGLHLIKDFIMYNKSKVGINHGVIYSYREGLDLITVYVYQTDTMYIARPNSTHVDHYKGGKDDK